MSPRQPRIRLLNCFARCDATVGTSIIRRASHLFLKHPSKPGMVTVARHAAIIIKPKTLAAILDQAGLTADHLRDLL